MKRGRTKTIKKEKAQISVPQETGNPTRFIHLEGFSEDQKQLIKHIARLFVAAVLRLANKNNLNQL